MIYLTAGHIFHVMHHDSFDSTNNVIVESALGLLMAWCLFGARASATIVMTWTGRCMPGLPNVMRTIRALLWLVVI